MRRNDFFKYLLLGGGGSESRSELESETLPYAFTSNSYKLRNYRIYGNTVNGESVGDLVTEGEHAWEYKVPVTISNGTDTQTIPIYLPEQIRKVGDEAEYIDYGEQKQHRVRKNLFDENTITEGAYIDKYTGNVVAGSVASNVSDFISVVPNNTYTLSYAYIELSSSNRRVICFYSALKEWVSFIEYSPLVNTVFNINVPNDIYYIKVTTDIKMTNVMLNSGSEALPYEPYIENTDLDVTLPALPTLPGTNVLSVGTAVQPSKVYLQGNISVDETQSASLQSLSPQNLKTMDSNDEVSLDVMPIDSPNLQLNDISETVGGEESAE